MVKSSFSEAQIERALAEWIAERGLMDDDAEEEATTLILEFLHSNQVRDAGLSEGDVKPS